ncbi:MAG: 4Fe-4S dicluster domain-containing protein [Ignavibacteriaceae bacterium]
MTKLTINLGDKATIKSNDIILLFNALRSAGYTVIGPTIRDGAIVYDELNSIDDLPVGWTDEQEGGSYRLKKRSDNAFFGYNVGPHSWKKFLFPPSLRLWNARKNRNNFQILPENNDTPKFAFIGVRACELHAMAVQDKVFMNGAYIDPVYKSRRENAFIVAVNCGQAGNTCFCTSMKTGPKATSGYDLSLTEIIQDEIHYFLIEVGSEIGAEILNLIPHESADNKDIESADRIVEETAKNMGRSLDTNNLKELLYNNYDNPRWDDVANRCLSCSNCTMVCPTCFCTTVEDVTDLKGENAERWRKWDSCFTVDFSYIHGGSIRSTVRSRYRQWLTHKLATWIDQFGSSGCVGCGRCITWCPVAIDLTEEVSIIRLSNNNSESLSSDKSDFREKHNH